MSGDRDLEAGLAALAKTERREQREQAIESGDTAALLEPSTETSAPTPAGAPSPGRPAATTRPGMKELALAALVLYLLVKFQGGSEKS